MNSSRYEADGRCWGRRRWHRSVRRCRKIPHRSPRDMRRHCWLKHQGPPVTPGHVGCHCGRHPSRHRGCGPGGLAHQSRRGPGRGHPAARRRRGISATRARGRDWRPALRCRSTSAVRGRRRGVRRGPACVVGGRVVGMGGSGSGQRQTHPQRARTQPCIGLAAASTTPTPPLHRTLEHIPLYVCMIHDGLSLPEMW